ncbi:6-phosphogluconolactonase [Pedosphaera parvula]|uniref:6-phosphogluconolactonase n=1 Tax=Pedosphaera parvula (strain Ellin514) TaxID=320771 RepID=B9XC32_PEDPL|nr:6-phosphogluconolactonase [Pedosphaera parvula]EEF62500.1 6-phosphogluconolactonase [Pedosphaera parvula Ellin514]
MAYELLTFANDKELAEEVARRWLAELAKRDTSVIYTVALSGGRITKAFFNEIVKQNKTKPISFDGVYFFWADERCVPPTDPESNYAVAKELLFDPLGIPERQVHRIRGEERELLALSDAVSNICNAAKLNAAGQPMLDLVFLGMGEDGHVASLFPQEVEEERQKPEIYRSVRAVKPPPQRITLGYKAIGAAKDIWVLVSGAGKEKALAESISPNGETPLAKVLKLGNQAKIFSDVKPGR